MLISLLFAPQLRELPPRVRGALSLSSPAALSQLPRLTVPGFPLPHSPVALREAVREREQDGLRLAQLRAQHRPQTPSRAAAVHMLNGTYSFGCPEADAQRRIGVLTRVSAPQVPRECRRVMNLIHERCVNCTRAAWATLERESGRVW